MKDRRYIILRKNLKTGEIDGYCEYSFSMGFEPDRVKVYACVLKTGAKSAEDNYQNYIHKKYWKKKNTDDWYEGGQRANSPNQREWLLLRTRLYKMRAEYKRQPYEFKLFRLGKNCPVRIDFSELNDMRKGRMKYDKFKWRNQPILEKFPEKW